MDLQGFIECPGLDFLRTRRVLRRSRYFHEGLNKNLIPLRVIGFLHFFA